MADQPRAQNIYNDNDFFKGYIQLPRQVQGLDGNPEWSEFRAMVSAIKEAKGLDLGCGFGWLCRWGL
jgi:hypothetical protein